jgi:hypothetical protein
MERLEGSILLGSPEQQEAERLRERNRVAKRASSIFELFKRMKKSRTLTSR